MLKKLYIEPTTKCNLNCKMCFRHTWFDEPFCDLSLEDYKQPKSVETIFFGGMGEPMFHKDILEMIRLAAETGAEKVFRRKFDDFEFASCLYCGHCELFAENKEDCIGNTHPACGGCLWAGGVLSCP